MDLSDTPVAKALKSSPTGVVEGLSALDGVPRLWVRRALNNIGLTIGVGLSTRGIYAAWRQEAVIIGPAVTCLLFSANLLGFGLRRQLSRRERAETALRANEAQFRVLSEAASDMVSRVDATGQRRYVSPASIILLGLPPEDLLGKAALDLVLADDRPSLEAAAVEVSAGEPRRASVQFRVRRFDGAERWIDAVARAINDPITGAPDGYIAAWRDVTDRKEAENRLIESETRYRLLTESATDIITCLDLDLRRTYVSPVCRSVLGYEPDELLGITPARAIHPDDALFTGRRFRMIAEGLLDRDALTNRLRHKAGHYIWVEAKITLMRDPATNRPAEILCVIRDISDRKAAADRLLAANENLERLFRHLARARDTAERASEAKSRFLAGVSHELRTPLNGIMGYAELLQIEGGLNEMQKARVDAMQASGQHLLSMITGVLDISEIETGHLDLHPSNFDLGELIAVCITLIRPLSQRKGLSLSSLPEPSGEAGINAPVTMMADATRLRQILVNLLGNAVKFTSDGSVKICFRPVEGNRVRIEVADTGPGIPLSDRWRLFQEFDRLGGEAIQVVEGSGLGLALSERLAKAMGGTIGYADNPGGGSIFWLELPLDRAELASPVADLIQTAASSQVAAPASSWRVLVVDDVSINRDIAASFLLAAGHHPTCAESGEEAVKLAAEQDFAVVLMDIRMPGIDGREATRRIRGLAGLRSQVPIVALTAQAFADEVAECRRAGINEHLAKPFSQSALLAAIARAQDASRSAPCLDIKQPLASESECFGANLPVLDVKVFEQTSGYLTAETVAGHLSNLIRRTEALLDGLRQAQGRVDADPNLDEALKRAAHILSGSAGMFGFERLSAVARQFENSANPPVADSHHMAESLQVAAVASVCEMQRRIAQPTGRYTEPA